MATRSLRRSTPVNRARVPLLAAKPVNEVCLEIEDHGVARRSAIDFFGLRNLRDPHPAAGRMAEQFINQNVSLLSSLDVRVDRDYDGRDVTLVIQAGNSVGAIPLISPTTARPDYGLVIQPRFPWTGIGPMLAEMGWRVGPTPLRLPLLRRSERRVPPWVLSSMILVRLSALLDSLDRRFEMVSVDRSAPRGRIDWAEYATKRLSTGNFLSVPCTFPDLRDDRHLKGAIRYSVEKQISALETQKEHGGFVHRLIEFARQLQRRVRTVPICIPSRSMLDMWLQRPMRTKHLREGLQGIEWTVEERGLAGLSDLQGIPWKMPMQQFFEAWVEVVFSSVARRTGGRLKVGRKRETTHPINWEPPYLGSQKALVPDLWMDFDGVTLIVDAKYKRHWEEMQKHSWVRVQEDLREQHRNDLLQVLAYGNLAKTISVVTCLVYPCSDESWESLRQRGRLFHKAEITIGDRSVRLWLTAIPMSTNLGPITAALSDEVRKLLGPGAQ
ncbi:MAG: hypothetical protein WBW33_03665 [Bryobacteraceae bacterium]